MQVDGTGGSPLSVPEQSEAAEAPNDATPTEHITIVTTAEAGQSAEPPAEAGNSEEQMSDAKKRSNEEEHVVKRLRSTEDTGVFVFLFFALSFRLHSDTDAPLQFCASHQQFQRRKELHLLEAKSLQLECTCGFSGEATVNSSNARLFVQCSICQRFMHLNCAAQILRRSQFRLMNFRVLICPRCRCRSLVDEGNTAPDAADAASTAEEEVNTQERASKSVRFQLPEQEAIEATEQIEQSDDAHDEQLAQHEHDDLAQSAKTEK
jgi:hypothetical protein